MVVNLMVVKHVKLVEPLESLPTSCPPLEGQPVLSLNPMYLGYHPNCVPAGLVVLVSGLYSDVGELHDLIRKPGH